MCKEIAMNDKDNILYSNNEFDSDLEGWEVNEPFIPNDTFTTDKDWNLDNPIHIKVGGLYRINGMTVTRLDRGERLRKKNGKKLVRGHGYKRIKVI